MHNLTVDQLRPANWPRIAHAPGIAAAWRQAHFAAQVAAELGKGWSVEEADDSHSAFCWFEDADGRGLVGRPTAPTPRQGKPVAAKLKFEGLEVKVEAADGRTLFDLSLAGRTVPDALAWLREHAERSLGPAQQEAQPAPDLPAHELNWLEGGEGRFSADEGPLNDLADLYAVTDEMLRRYADAIPHTTEPVCWPHHFDHASLTELARDESGMVRSIGVGLTPPDGLESSGYWYVSPWSRDGLGAQGAAWPDLPAGRWVERGGPLKMALLPVSEVITAGTPAAQEEAVVGFIAEAHRACVAALCG